MEDRELLELAAKAAGYELHDHTILGDGVWLYGEGESKSEDGRTIFFWSPLADDGDALRLSRSLSIDIHYLVDVSPAYMPCAVKASHWQGAWMIAEDIVGSFDGSHLRLAIVGVAAQIGAAKP